MRKRSRIRHGVMLGGLCVSLAACSHETIQGNNWIGPATIPRGREITPEAAMRDDVAGWAMLNCAVVENNRTGDCQIVADFPQGMGFGAAALKLQNGMDVTRDENFGRLARSPGKRFFVPVVFCPSGTADWCPPQMKAAAITFSENLRAGERAR